MDQTSASASFTLFGIRVDSAAPVHITPVIWESAVSRAGMQVVLADLWTLLMAQRDFAVWEALSAAEFVLPLGDDPIIRRAARLQHLPVTRADGLLFDLFDAAASSRSRVVIVAPSSERGTDRALLRQVWPELQVTALLPGEVDDPEGDRELVRAVNAVGPELLVLGGGSPWQEGWSYAHRDDLEFGAAVLLPTLHPALAALAQRAGQPVTGVKRLRRQAAIRRAIDTTIGPVASASAETVGAWLQEAREGLADWSATLSSRRRPGPPSQVALPSLGTGMVGQRARAGRTANESSARWAGISPLARLGPPRGAAGLPPPAQRDGQTSAPQHDPDAGPLSSMPDDRDYWADQPTSALTLDQLSAAARAARESDAAAQTGNGAHPPASQRPAADISAHGTLEEPSPLDDDLYDDEQLLVVDGHAPVDWSAFLEAEQGHDDLPPTTKLDPRAARDEQHEFSVLVPPDGPEPQMPSETHDASNPGTSGDVSNGAHLEPPRGHIVPRYVIRRSRRRLMRERRYHRALKPRQRHG